MHKMTWEQLKSHIETMDEEQLKQDVAVYYHYFDEYFPVQTIEFASETDVLDKNHPFLSFGNIDM